MSGWADIAAALPYGWQICWALKVEGIPYLLVERDLDGSDPTGYTSDACLIVEGSDKFGCQIDPRGGIGKAYDLTFMLLRTTATQGLFSRPTNVTRLTSTLDWDETTSAVVEDSSGFDAGPSHFWIGRECVKYASKADATHFNTLTRGEPNAEWRGYQYDLKSSIGSWVSDSPMLWRGRIVELWAIPVDPFGGTNGSDVLDEAAMVWRGHIQTDPVGTYDGWTLSCRSQERRLTDPVGVEASGQGEWVIGADPDVVVDPSFTINFWYQWDFNPATSGEFTVTPFSSYSAGDEIPLSQARADIVSAWSASASGATAPMPTYVGELKWVEISSHQTAPGSGQAYLSWWAAQFDGNSVGGEGEVVTSLLGPSVVGFQLSGTGTGVAIPVPTTGTAWVNTGLLCYAAESIKALIITLDEGDPGDLPTAGWVILEVGEDQVTYEYTNLYLLADDTQEVRLTLAPGQSNLGQFMADVISGNPSGFSVRFASKVGPGSPQDSMRKMLLSSGRGDNDATYDTEPRRAGLDLDSVDVDSFDDNLDEAWTSVGEQEILLDDTASMEKIWGGLIALSDRNIVSTAEADGSAVKIRVVQTSLADTGLASLTIEDKHLLVAGDGSSPVREVYPSRSPNMVTVKLVDDRGKKAGKINAIDLVARDAQGDSKWSLEARGFDPFKLRSPIGTWAAARFADHQVVRFYELDVVPWLADDHGVPVEVGDAINLDISHFRMWDPADGSSGYAGPGRVLGRQIGLADYSMRLLVGVSGVYELHALSPSAEVIDYDHPTAPTWIEVSGDYVSLFEEFLAYDDVSFDIVAYVRGYDDVSTDGFEITGVSTVSGDCRLTVNSVTGSPDLSAATYYVTIPDRAHCNPTQQRHLHPNTPNAAWR